LDVLKPEDIVNFIKYHHIKITKKTIEKALFKMLDFNKAISISENNLQEIPKIYKQYKKLLSEEQQNHFDKQLEKIRKILHP